MPERLQKILARHGLGSRREIERWIAEGRVTVNLIPAVIGAQYRDGDRIAIDGKEVTARLVEVVPQVLLYHKVQGQPIGHEPERDATDAGAETVIDKLPSVRGSRWVPINPMHAGDSGMVLFTNDGNLSYALTRRKRWIPTAYMVRVLAPDRGADAPEIPPHVDYDDERVEFSKVVAVVGGPQEDARANLWYRVDIQRADRRAAIRALFESRDLKVSRMTQIAFGAIDLPRDLPRGRHRALPEDQVLALYELAQLPAPSLEPRETKPVHRPKRRPPPDRRRVAKTKSPGAVRQDQSGSRRSPAPNSARSKRPKRRSPR